MVKVYLEERAGRIRGRREKRKQARVARTRREILRYTFLCALLFIGVTGFIKVSWSVADPEIDIKVAGNQVTSAKQIRRVLMSCMQRPIYTLNPKTLERQVESLPDVQRAFVRRYLFPRPHLIVEVMEEFPWASYAASPDQPVTAVISQTGRFIPIAQFPNVPQPALKIFGKPESQFNETTVAQWSNWVNFVAAQSQHPVEYVDMRKANNVELKTGDLNLHLGAADSMLSKRLSRLSSVLPVIASLDKESIDYIDLSLDSNVPLKISNSKPHGTQQQAARSIAQPASHPIAGEAIAAPRGSGTSPAAALPAEPIAQQEPSPNM